jgi:ABC-2 type transport system permease protein
MNFVIFRLTLRQLLGRRRTVLLVLFALIPVAVALAVRASDPNGYIPQRFAARALLNGLIVTTLLPLGSLVFATSAVGGEIEDSTFVYLLSKPISRGLIVAEKLAASWLATAVLTGAAALVAGLATLLGHNEQQIVSGFTVAIIAGSLVYSAVFVLLSLVTSRALIVGLIYVFFWEGVVTTLFSGTKYLSIRQYTLGFAGALSDTSDNVFSAQLDWLPAVIMALIVTALATYLAVYKLKRLELGEST